MRDRIRPVSGLFLGLSLLCQTGVSILGKSAAMHLGKPTITAFLTSPWYLGGLACLALQAVAWQLVLRQVRLFVAYLVTSLNYFLVLAVSRIFFLERISLANIAGAAVIVAGVYLVVREDLP